MMALQKQVITIDFGFGGIDQQTDERRVVSTKLTTAQNARFSKTGRIDRRNGTELVSSDYGAARLIVNGNAVLVAQRIPYGFPLNDLSFSYTNMIVALPFAEVVASRPPISAPPLSITGGGGSCWTSAESTNYQCFVYGVGSTSSTALNVCMFSKTTGEIAYSYSLLNATKPVLISDPRGNDSFVFAAVDSSTSSATVSLYVVTPSTTPVLVAGIAAEAVAVGNNEYDIVGAVDETYGALVFAAVAKGGSGAKVIRGRWPASDGSGTALSSTTVAASSSVGRVAFSNFLNRSVSLQYEALRLVYHDTGAGLRTVGFSNTLTITHANTSLTTSLTAPNHIIACNSATSGDGIGTTYVMAEYGNATTYLTTTQVWRVYSGATPSSWTTIQAASIASNAIVFDGVSTMPCWWASLDLPSQKTNFLYVIDPTTTLSRTVARAYHTKAFGSIPRQTSRPPALFVGDSLASPMFGTKRISTSMLVQRVASDPVSTTQRAEFILESVDANVGRGFGWHQAPIRNEVLVSGGHLCYWAGDNVAPPNAPQLLPNMVSASGVYSGSGSLTTGSYQVTAIYESIDRAGRLRRSAPCAPTAVTLSGTQNQISLTVHTYPLDDGTDPAIVIYRTLSNATVFYRASSLYRSAWGLGATVSITLNANDATIGAYEPLYTTNGSIENWQPDCPIAIASNGRRALAVSGVNPNFVMEGKAITDQAGASFFEEIGRYITTHGSRIYALASHHDTWFAFKESCVFAATGDGPDDTGQNETLGEFRPVTPGIGCTEPRSLLVTSEGVVFKSQRGFYFIGGDQALSYIGADIENYNSQTVIDAAYNPTTNECHFAMSGGDTLVLSLWTTKQGIDPRWTLDPSTTYSPISALGFASGKRYIVNSYASGGGIYRESATYYDAHAQSATTTPFVVETAWIPLGQQQGFGRAYKATVLGTLPAAQTSLTVTVSVAWDYDDTNYSQEFSISAANMKRVGGVVQFEVPFSRQKGESLRLKITQNVSTSNTALQCLSLNQVQLLVGVKAQNNKLPPTARAVEG